MLEEAKALIQLGLPIIPVCPHDHSHMTPNHITRCRCAGKTPLIAGWTERDRTTMEDLQNWNLQWKGHFNIGMPLGKASGYCGIDVDGDAGVQLLMEMSKGDLPSTWEFSTAAGSRLLYRIPEGIETKKFKQVGNGPHEECALICDGQQTVMPPSIHHTGAVYTWVEGHSPFDIPCAIAPNWLIAKIRKDGSVPGVGSVPRTSPAREPSFGGFDFLSEFGSGDTGAADADDLPWDDDPTGTPGMSFMPPPDSEAKGKPMKPQRHAKTVTEEMLTQMIPEGQRDNTMTTIVGHYCANRDLRRLGKDMILNICLEHNRTHCDPPLDDQAIIDKVNYFFEAETAKDEAYKSGKTQKPVFEASQMAKNVIKHLTNQGVVLQYDQFTKMYYYTMIDEGPWLCTRDTVLINRWIREVITSPHYGDPSWDKKSYIEETRAALDEAFTSAFKSVSDFDLGAHSEELCKYIVVKDGMYDWRNKKMLPWDPSFHTTISFDIDFDADAECPHWQEYLSQWLPDPSVQAVVQEFLGYCLIPNTNFRKAMFLYGKGRNGKSVFVEFLQEFFVGLASTLSYDALFQRFGPANLKDKLVNIYDDTNVSFAKDTGIAKNLIAGGQISAEFKGKDHFVFTNIARIIFSAQETPRTADNTLAWYDRWFFVKFPNTFRTSNATKDAMMENMRKERAGIFNWMVEGLRRLMENDQFTASAQLDDYTAEYRGLNDNVIQFCNEFCTRLQADDANQRISIGHLYEVYQMFTEKDNLRCVSKKVFSQRIQDAGFAKKTGQVDKITTTYFEGLALNYSSDSVNQYLLEIRVILSRNS